MITLTIARRELAATFNTPIGWLVMAAFLFIGGIFWASMLDYYASRSVDLIANPYAQQQMSMVDHLLSPYFGNLSVVLLMVCPALSMRLFSEETKQRTMELLLTSPVSTTEIVLGKFLGAMGFVGVMLLCTAYVPLLLMWFGNPDPGALLGGYASLVAVSAGIIAMGMLFSAMTSNQIVALILTFVAALALWVLPWVNNDPESWQQRASLVAHVTELSRGAMQLSDLVYFLSFTGFFLFATHQRVEAHRWS